MELKDDSGKLFYVGGCVRDEILDLPSVDIDVCYEGDVIDYVLARNYTIIKAQKDIRTVKVLIDGREIDFASTRKEIYPKPGHLPVTIKTGCPLKDDLTRRDFTINSIAKSVKTGQIFDPTGGCEDIKTKILRVHHDKSFIDDPTRIIRGLKFSLRFGFKFDPHTEDLKNEYLNNVNYDMSFSRLKKELIDCFNLNFDEALERFINEGMYKLLTSTLPQKPLISIKSIVNEFKISSPWLLYLGNIDLSRLSLTKTESKIINGLKKIRQSKNPLLECTKSEVQTVLLWTIYDNPEQGLYYLRNREKIKPFITGKELLHLGLKGKQIGKVMELIQEARFKNPKLNLDDELSIVKTFQDRL